MRRSSERKRKKVRVREREKDIVISNSILVAQK